MTLLLKIWFLTLLSFQISPCLSIIIKGLNETGCLFIRFVFQRQKIDVPQSYLDQNWIGCLRLQIISMLRITIETLDGKVAGSSILSFKNENFDVSKDFLAKIGYVAPLSLQIFSLIRIIITNLDETVCCLILLVFQRQKFCCITKLFC